MIHIIENIQNRIRRIEPAGTSLSITRAGIGFGTMASNPAGVTCGVTCGGTFHAWYHGDTDSDT